MPTRRDVMWAAPLGVVAVGLAAAGWVLVGPGSGSGLGGAFNLIDGDGRPVTEVAFRGRWTLLYFGYTHCPDACPTALGDMANCLDLLEPRRRDAVSLMFVTIDPARDTPAAMREYVRAFDVPITALSGSAAQVAGAARAFRVYYAEHRTADGYEMDHTDVIYVVDPRGRVTATLPGGTAPARLADQLRTLMG